MKLKKAKDSLSLIWQIVDPIRIEYEWKEFGKIYGKKATRLMKQLVPTEPVLLYHLVTHSYREMGLKDKEIEARIDEYTDEIWADDAEHFRHTIEKTQREYRKILERND